MSVALGTICVFNYGEALKEEDRASGIVPVYGSNGIVGWHDRAITHGPTIVIGRKGSIGEVHYSEVPCYPIDTTYFIDCTRVPCDMTWLFYMLKALDLTEMNKSAAVPGLNRDDAYRERIPLPPLAEQRRIAAILRAADEERRRRRYTQTLSDGLLGEVFVRMFGDPATNPMGWEVRKLGAFIAFVTSGSRGWAEFYADSGAQFIRVQNLHDHQLDLQDIAYVMPPRGAETQRTRVQPGDILLAITGATIGLCALVRSDIEESYVSQHVAIIRLGSRIDPEFVSAFISHPRGGQLQIGAINYGDTKPGLGLDQIRDMKIICPPLGLQRQFAAIVAEHERVRRQQQESARQSDHLFEALLRRAFAGAQ